MIRCELCGKEFNVIRELSYHLTFHHKEITKKEYIKKYLYNDNIECPICGKDRKLYQFEFLETCGSKKCNIELRKKTCFERYGVDVPLKSNKIKEKVKQTCLDKYGTEHVLQNKEIRDKIKQTNLDKYGAEYTLQNKEVRDKGKKTLLEKYGVDNPLKSKEIQEKVKQTCLDKYGVDNPMKSKDIKEKNIRTVLEKYNVDNISKNHNIINKKKNKFIKKYGVDNPFKSDKIKEKIITNKKNNFIESVSNNRPDLEFIEFIGNYYSDYTCKWKCLKCNTEFEDYARATNNWLHPRCPNCNPVKYSSIENKVYNYLLEIGFNDNDILRNDRQTITPYELDLYIPHLNIAIECDGKYWHSDEKLLEKYDMTYNDHKQLKQQLCKENNIILLHFTEEEINNEFKKVKDIINGHL